MKTIGLVIKNVFKEEKKEVPKKGKTTSKKDEK